MLSSNIPEAALLSSLFMSASGPVKNKLGIMLGFIKKAINENAGELLSTGQLRLKQKSHWRLWRQAKSRNALIPFTGRNAAENPGEAGGGAGNFRPTPHAHRRSVEPYLSFSDSCLISSERTQKEKGIFVITQQKETIKRKHSLYHLFMKEGF